MKNALIAAIVAALVASFGAGAYTAPSRSQLDMRVQTLEERFNALESVNEAEHEAFRRYTSALARCTQKEEERENICIARLVYEGRLP